MYPRTPILVPIERSWRPAWGVRVDEGPVWVNIEGPKAGRMDSEGPVWVDGREWVNKETLVWVGEGFNKGPVWVNNSDEGPAWGGWVDKEAPAWVDEKREQAWIDKGPVWVGDEWVEDKDQPFWIEVSHGG